MRKLLDYYLDEGNSVKALKILKRLIDIDNRNPYYYKQMIFTLIDIDKGEEAKKVAEIAFNKTGEKYFREIFTPSGDETLKIEEVEFNNLTISLMLSLFAGREGVYARQWKNPKGESGYIPVYEPLSEKVVRNHLLGNITAGVYQIRMDNTVNWMVFDIDVEKFVLNNFLGNDDQRKLIQNKINKVSYKIWNECWQHNIPCYLENSGFKGRHAWIFFANPVPAGLAKKFGETLINGIKDVPIEIHVEVFPKQKFVKSGGLGNLVKMPLGIHLKSGRRSYFIEDNKKVKDVTNFLSSIKFAYGDTLLDYINLNRRNIITYPKRAVESNKKVIIDSKEGTDNQTKPDEAPVKVKPHISQYDINRDEEFLYLITKCPVLKEIFKKALNEHNLTNDEVIVITHTIGYLENGVEAANYIFSKCYNIPADKFLKSRLNGNPISCAKIRSRVPYITSRVSCNCKFPENLGLYPTPLLHLKTKEIERGNLIGSSLDLLQIQELIGEYMKIKKELSELTLLLESYEKKLDEVFKNSGVEELSTPFGKLKRVEKDGKVRFELEI